MLFSCDHDAHRHYLNSTNQSLSQKICRNTFFNAIGRLWGILVALVLTPYIIRHIGVERYGIWALVGVITGYFGLLDFGVGTSFVKYIAEFYAKRDYEKINQVVNTGFVFYTVFAILIIVLGFLFINPLLSFFKIPPQMLNEVRFVFLLGIIIFGVSNALSPFLAVQTGLQRMDITNKISIAVSIPTVLGTVFFLEKGYGLP
ncbi:MAG: lipopolysaccharide biosynthesis protein, partial [Elusimicrobiales bacterium]